MPGPDLVDGRFLILEDEPARGGGFATVRKAIDIRSGRHVAVKFVSGASDDVVMKLFHREVDHLKRSTHPNIVRFVGSGMDETGNPYLAIEWVERSYKDVLEEDSAPEWGDFLEQVLQPLTSAIAYLHERRIEHRDVKPGNILVSDADASPLLADFGISKLKRSDDDTSLTLASFYSPLYAPPEMSSGVPFVRDVYSLGVLFVQAITQPNQRASDHFELRGILEQHALPPEIHALIASAIDIDPSKRPANAIDLLFRLKRAMNAQQPRGPKARLFIGLTNSARQQIVGPDGFPDRADDLVSKDLQGASHVSFRWDNENLQYDKSVLLLAGESMRMTIKYDATRRNLVIVGVKFPEFEDLERDRRRALQVDGFIDWTTRRPLDVSSQESNYDTLLERLSAHYDARDDAAAVDESLESQLLSGWRRTLVARESLAVADLTTLDFDGHGDRARESEFSLLQEPEVDLVDTEWQLLDVAGKPVARGVAVHQSERKLTIRWNWRNDGAIKPQGRLHPYLGPSQTAIDRQRDAIRRLETGKSAQPKLLEIVADPSSATPPATGIEPNWIADLDADKRDAVKAAVGVAECMIVTGPPGTGKTRFITEAVAQTLLAKPTARILIVSQTHVAVDNALERLAESGIGDVVRIGKVDDKRIAVSSHPLLLDVQLAKWAHATRERAEKYFDGISATAGIKREHLRAVLLLEELLAVARNQLQLESRVPAIEAIEDQTASRVGSAQDPTELRRKIEDARARQIEILKQAQTLLGSDLTFSSPPPLEELESAVELLLSQSEESDELLKLLRLQADWLQRISSDERLAATYLESSKVIAGTCLGFISHPAVRDLTFDLCIVDEASKATSTELMVPLVRSERFVLVGDANQLPPLDEQLLRNHAVLAENDLTQDFVRETLFERLAHGLPSSNRFALTEQYRMIAPIGDLISSCFYEGALKSPNKVGVVGYEYFAKSVLWIDTSGNARRREQRDVKSSASFLNRFEADIVFDRLEALDLAIERRLVTPPADGSQYKVLLIAPYRSQLDELSRRLVRMERVPKHLTVEIESVDAVQGREADFAIFSVTRSNPEGELGFLGADYWRRINVALSRARFGLIVVGDAAFCETRPGGLKKVLGYIRDNTATCELRPASVSD